LTKKNPNKLSEKACISNTNHHQTNKAKGLLYLASRCKAGVEIVFIHPVLQIPDPQGPDLVNAGGLLLRRRLGGGSPHGRRSLGLRRHHDVGLLLRRRLLILLRWLLPHGGRSHAESWLLHHLLTNKSKIVERKRESESERGKLKREKE